MPLQVLDHLTMGTNRRQVAVRLEHPLVAEEHDSYGSRALWVHRARNSGIVVAVRPGVLMHIELEN